MPRLVLTRKLHERVRILVPAGAEREVWVEVVAVRCEQVRLAVEADAAVVVHRAELLAERREGDPPRDVRGDRVTDVTDAKE